MKKYSLPLLIILLVLANIATFAYFKSKLTDMRSQSSFKVIAESRNLPNGTDVLTNCLQKAGIDYQTSDGNVLVREVDGRTAVGKCS